MVRENLTEDPANFFSPIHLAPIKADDVRICRKQRRDFSRIPVIPALEKTVIELFDLFLTGIRSHLVHPVYPVSPFLRFHSYSNIP